MECTSICTIITACDAISVGKEINLENILREHEGAFSGATSRLLQKSICQAGHLLPAVQMAAIFRSESIRRESWVFCRIPVCYVVAGT